MSRFLAGLLWVWLFATGVAAQDGSALARFESGAIAASRGSVVADMTLSQGVPWRAYVLADPWRLVLDFSQVQWADGQAADINRAQAVVDVQTGPVRPGWSRLVATLGGPMAIDEAAMALDAENGQARLRVRFSARAEADARVLAGPPPDAVQALPAATARQAIGRSDGALVIMLDPGHGGVDPGAERDGVRESALTLTFSRELREALLRTGRYEVLVTRSEDAFVSLEARIAAAHEAGADLFVSLHADAIEQGVAHGASVYTLSTDASDAASAALAERHERDDLLSGVDLSGSDDQVARVLMDLARLDNTPRSEALARNVIDGILNAVGHVHKRPLRSADFSVLKAADIPSVLIELGFLSTRKDLENLQDPVWRAGMAAGIRDGIDAWALEDSALQGLRRQ